MKQFHAQIFAALFLLSLLGCNDAEIVTSTSEQGTESSAASVDNPDTKTSASHAEDALATSNADSTPEQRLQDKIAEGVRILDSRDYRAFILAFMRPDQVDDASMVENFTESLSENGLGEKTLEAFKSIHGQQPEIQPNGRAVFPLEK